MIRSALSVHGVTYTRSNPGCTARCAGSVGIGILAWMVLFARLMTMTLPVSSWTHLRDGQAPRSRFRLSDRDRTLSLGRRAPPHPT